MLDGNDYKFRKFAIKKCATIAKVQGFPAFAIENGGQCLGGKDILQTYNMYGASRACKVDGRGGPWSMEVYKFTSKLFYQLWSLGYPSSIWVLFSVKWSWLKYKLERGS